MNARTKPGLVLLLLMTVCLWGLGAGCSADRTGFDDGKAYRGGPCERDTDCNTGRRCIGGTCVTDYGDCTTDNDCQDDTYCACPPSILADRCACVPWGQPPRGRFDPMCQGAAFLPEDFKNPVVKCQWPPATGTPPAYKDVLATPIVIDLDGDKLPEIVFSAGWLGTVHLVAISGRDCSVLWDKTPGIAGCTSIAAADLDGDGKVEIVALGPGIVVLDNKGDVLTSRVEPGGSCVRDYPPAIANIDGVGPPEIVLGVGVFRYLSTPKPQVQILWNKNLIEEGAWGTVSTVADLDGDGIAEVVTGHNVFHGITGADKTPAIMKNLVGGYSAIGDFNADGKPDIVLVSSRTGDQKVAVIDYSAGTFIMPPTPAVDGWGGPPTIADFDGDGRPEFATAGAHYYYVYSPDCLKTPKPAKCKGSDEGVLWQSPTQDVSSGSTGSSVFDFNGDKIAEVVYRDECWLRVYSGIDGTKLFAAPATSGTILDLPVVADVDGDGHAEIVVASDSAQNDMCRRSFPTELGIVHPGATWGVRILEDPSDRWVGSRALWNQHSYHITNINDDGSVPQSEPPSWRAGNSYRQNVQGAGQSTESQPDATGKIGLPVDSGDCTKLFRVSGVVCNRGVAPLPPSLPATFYIGDPRQPGARAICTGRTASPTLSGECQPVACSWDDPPPGPYDLWMRVSDDGSGKRTQPQCKGGNDLAHLPQAQCGVTPG